MMGTVGKRPRSRRRGPGMTGRGPRARDADYRPLDLDRIRGGVPRRESGAGGDWFSRRVTNSEKSYMCPGCRQIIPPGVSHIVAWQADYVAGDVAALDGRRHWHSGCWAARDRRH